MTDQNNQPDILKLDEVKSVPRQIDYKGVAYNLKELSVGEFIDMSRKTKAVEETLSEDSSGDDVVKRFIEIITESFPTMTEEVIRTMSLAQMMMVMSFVMKDAEDQQKESAKKKPVKKSPKAA